MTPPTLGEIALEPMIAAMTTEQRRACRHIIGELREMRRRRDAWRNRVETFLDEWSHLTTQARMARAGQRKAENEKEGLHRTIASINDENRRLGEEVGKLAARVAELESSNAELIDKHNVLVEENHRLQWCIDDYESDDLTKPDMCHNCMEPTDMCHCGEWCVECGMPSSECCCTVEDCDLGLDDWYVDTDEEEES